METNCSLVNNTSHINIFNKSLIDVQPQPISVNWLCQCKTILSCEKITQDYTSTTEQKTCHWSAYITQLEHHLCSVDHWLTYTDHTLIITIIINPLTARVVGAPQMNLQTVFSIFPCSPLLSGTCRTPSLSIPRSCLPTSSFVRLVFFPLSLCLARWFWLDLMNGKHDHTSAVCVSLRWSGGLRVVQLPAGSWHGLPCWYNGLCLRHSDMCRQYKRCSGDSKSTGHHSHTVYSTVLLTALSCLCSLFLLLQSSHLEQPPPRHPTLCYSTFLQKQTEDSSLCTSQQYCPSSQQSV